MAGTNTADLDNPSARNTISNAAVPEATAQFGDGPAPAATSAPVGGASKAPKPAAVLADGRWPGYGKDTAMIGAGGTIGLAQFVNGVHIDFEVEVFRIDTADRSMWVRVTARSSLPTPLHVKPSLVYRKLPDGRAYIQT